MKYSLFLLLLVSTLSAYTTIDLGFEDRCNPVVYWTNAIPNEWGAVEMQYASYIPPIPPDTWMTNVFVITATPHAGYIFSHWQWGPGFTDGDPEIIVGDPVVEVIYRTETNDEPFPCPTVVMPPTMFSAVFKTAPQAPVLDLETFYESNSGESITVDATPTNGYPTTYTYQWYWKYIGTNSYFFISPNAGGSASTFQILGNSDNNGTWKVEVTNEAGTTAAEFNYRVYADSDSDGLSDGQEEFVFGTDPSLTDTDGDELGDGTEVNTYASNPLAADTTGDGFTDGFLVSAGFIPTSDYNALRTETVNQMLDLRIGSTIIQVTNNEASVQIQMEESSDLESWNEIGDAATMTVPADSETKFFRFKMTE